MFEQTRRVYEVMAYAKADDDQPRTRDTYPRKADALRDAQVRASAFGRVEVNALFVDINDDGNIFGADLIAAYENGRKTTK